MKDKIIAHIRKHKVEYSCLATAIATAGITVIMMRKVGSRPISVAVGDATNCAVGVIGERAVLNNVSFISSHRQGSPSWVVRCLETDEVFTSQYKAALAMNLPQSHISEHLNGKMDHVRGYHFERICMAA